MTIFILLAHLFMSQHAVIGKVAIDLSIPQAERIDGLIMITDNGHVIGNSHDRHCVFVHKLKGAVGLRFHVSVAIELDVDRFVRLPVLPSESFILITPSCYLLLLGKKFFRLILRRMLKINRCQRRHC